MTTLDHVLAYFQIDPTGIATKARRMPIEIPNSGRADLARLFCALGFKNGAEIGVETGLYAEVLCRKNPGLRLLAVDAWKAYSNYRLHVTQTKVDDLMRQAMVRLSPYDVEFKRQFSLDAVKDVADGSLDFCFLDANHDFKHISEDLCAWIPKVRPQGVIAGHDWVRRSNPADGVHVCEVVTAYTQAFQTYPWFVLGLKEIKPGEVRDRPRSWFWVKE